MLKLYTSKNTREENLGMGKDFLKHKKHKV